MNRSEFLSTGAVRVACPFDPALDRSTEEYRARINRYHVSRDPKELEGLELSGHRIRWFHIRRLPRSVAAQIDATAKGQIGSQIAAFRSSVVAVEHLDKDDGGFEERWEPECAKPGNDLKSGLTIQELDLFTPEEMYDIGAVARGRASLRHGKQPFFPPLESSVRALAEMQIAFSGLVDGSPAAASRKRGEPGASSTTTPPTPVARESSGAKPTDAPAKGSPPPKRKRTRGKTKSKPSGKS